MRKIKTIKSSSDNAIAYYTKDEQHKLETEYYSDSEQHSYLATEWHGRGAAALGLEGKVSAADLEKTMKGFNSAGERIRPQPKDRVERYAHDFTISAPKSVSMALYLGEDSSIFAAHQDAVRKTLDLVESRYAKARIMVDGERHSEDTGNIAVAIINHATSRANDPQLHSHCLIQNATLRSDGQWRSLFPEGINQADWLGHFYRAELERNLNQIGYATYQTRDGFELKGLSKEELEAFSTRTNEIHQYLKRNGLDDTPTNRQKAALESRQDKTKAKSLEELQGHWKAEAKICGITIPKPSETPVFQKQSAPHDLINSAIAHYSERLVSFRRDDLYRYAFELGVTPELKELDDAIATHPDLIEYEFGKFTTQSALDREIESIELMQEGKDSFDSYGIKDLPETLNPGQKDAIEGVLDSNDQVMVWHGKSGVGKTFALGELKAASDITIRGLSPTRKAAQELAESLGIETDTVAGHLLKDSGKGELWIVDEAGLLDAESGLKLLQKATEQNARLLLVGDVRQNQSIGAGSFLRSLIDNGAETWNLSKILRQQNDIQHRAVQLISDGKGTDALSLLDEHGYINQISNREERAAAIAKDYIKHPESLIVAGTNADRAAIADAIRVELGLRDDRSIDRLVPISLTKEQLKQIHNFQAGEFIRLERKYKTTALQRGKLYKVVGKEGKDLLLESANGRNFRFDPSKYKDKSLYKPESIAIDVGDRVRWTRNDRALGLSNGDEATVKAIDDKSITLATQKGLRTLPLNQPLSLDYGYSSTTYQGQGQTAKRVLVSATDDPTSSVEPFYVATSRQRQDLTVFAEDKEQLYEWVKKSNQQANPLELVSQREETPIERKTPIEKPVQVPIYWKPEYQESDRPSKIEPHHWEEFKKSAIHPDLIAANLESIQGVPVQVRLLEEKLASMGSGQFPTKSMSKLMDRYQELADHGGWYGKAGVDPLKDWQPSTWGCFKGDRPRIGDDGDPIKYEHPKDVERQFYLANVPDELAAKILSKHGIDFKPGQNFWRIVHEQNLPVVFTEGYKKALSGLSQGEIVIGVSGVNALYQANEKVNGKKFKLIERRLTPPAKVWATPGRQITFAFDQDTKLKSILNVRRDLVRAIELMPECQCLVANWDGKRGKGIDDLNVRNPRLFINAIHRAVLSDKTVRAHYRYLYNQQKKKGLSDSEIWLKVSRENDIRDGDRVLQQSDTARAGNREEYLKQVKHQAVKLMQQPKQVKRIRI